MIPQLVHTIRGPETSAKHGVAQASPGLELHGPSFDYLLDEKRRSLEVDDELEFGSEIGWAVRSASHRAECGRPKMKRGELD
jgi:hypothetical protein